jgi:hypothetical protein
MLSTYTQDYVLGYSQPCLRDLIVGAESRTSGALSSYPSKTGVFPQAVKWCPDTKHEFFGSLLAAIRETPPPRENHVDGGSRHPI